MKHPEANGDRGSYLQTDDSQDLNGFVLNSYKGDLRRLEAARRMCKRLYR